MTLKRNDAIAIVSALVVGVVSGSYLYMTGFAPNYEEALKPTPVEEIAAYSIVGETYGGMRFGTPPSFRLFDNGMFTYVPFAEDPANPPVPVEGEIPGWLIDELDSALTRSELLRASEPFTPEMCAQMIDGLEYRYQVTWGDDTYTLDTCGTAFTNDSALGQALLSVWEVAAAAASPAP